MTDQVVLRPEAELEVFEAYSWYEGQAEGLGEEFLRAVDACLAAIQRNPTSYSLIHKEVRRALLRKFPYCIFYLIESETVIILACFRRIAIPSSGKTAYNHFALIMDPIIILQAGVADGTVLLFATIGEIFAERSGVMNLGVEGMMLIGAMSAFSVTASTGNGWLGLLVGMLIAGLLALLHGVVTIHFQADQVVSGLALTFLGAGLSLVFGEGLSKAGAVALLPRFSIPGLSAIPLLGPILFIDQSVMVYIGYLLVPLAWFYINRTRPGLHLRAVGENPAAADAMGINVYRLRYGYVFFGGMMAGLAGGTIGLAISPGWFSELTTSGQGWIAVGLVIFAQWNPWRAAFGAYAFGALRRVILDIQGPATLFGLANPFFYNPYLGFFMQMLPYAFTIVVLILGSRTALRQRLGAPATLGVPYVRGERGK